MKKIAYILIPATSIALLAGCSNNTKRNSESSLPKTTVHSKSSKKPTKNVAKEDAEKLASMINDNQIIIKLTHDPNSSTDWNIAKTGKESNIQNAPQGALTLDQIVDKYKLNTKQKNGLENGLMNAPSALNVYKPTELYATLTNAKIKKGKDDVLNKTTYTVDAIFTVKTNNNVSGTSEFPFSRDCFFE